MSRVAVAIIAYDGVDDLDLVGCLSPLIKAQEMGAPISVEVVSSSSVARMSSGLCLTDVRLHGGRYDVVVVPGGRGSRDVHEDSGLARWLVSHAAAEVHAVCSGALILARLGLLKGVPASIHHDKREELTDLGVDYRPGHSRGDLRTSIGGYAFSKPKGVLVGLEVLARHAPDFIDKVRDRLELDAT